LIRHWWHIKWLLQQLFVAAGTSLSSSYLAMIGGHTYRHTDWWEGFMKYAVEMSSGVMIYIRSFIKINSGIQKLIRGIYRHRQHGDRISLLSFFKIRKVG
jgi:hypothetical protein